MKKYKWLHETQPWKQKCPPIHNPAWQCCPLVYRKALLKPYQLSAGFFGKRCSELREEEVIHSCRFEDSRGPCLYLMGEIFPRGLRVQDLQEFHPQDLTMQLILDLFGAVLLNTDRREPAKAFPFSQGVSKHIPTSSLHLFPCYSFSFFFFFSTVKEILISCLAWFSSRSLLPPASRCGFFLRVGSCWAITCLSLSLGLRGQAAGSGVSWPPQSCLTPAQRQQPTSTFKHDPVCWPVTSPCWSPTAMHCILEKCSVSQLYFRSCFPW